MEDLVLCNDFDLNYFNNTELEDFDSGCSSMPSSPSLSDLSGSSFDDFTDDFLIKDIDIHGNNQAIMNEADVNPLINIKTEIDFEDDLGTDDCILPDSNDFLGMFINGYDLFRDSSTFDGKKDMSLYNANVQEIETISEEITVKTELPVQEESCVGPVCRKRSAANKNACDHTYACEEVPNENSFDNKEEESYLEKRRRNNLAAKKSRQLKRAKEIENVKRCEKLSKENKTLQKELKNLRSLVSRLESQVKHS